MNCLVLLSSDAVCTCTSALKYPHKCSFTWVWVQEVVFERIQSCAKNNSQLSMCIVTDFLQNNVSAAHEKAKGILVRDDEILTDLA